MVGAPSPYRFPEGPLHDFQTMPAQAQAQRAGGEVRDDCSATRLRGKTKLCLLTPACAVRAKRQGVEWKERQTPLLQVKKRTGALSLV
eukprot:1698328-Rhodomonas_salina.1